MILGPDGSAYRTDTDIRPTTDRETARFGRRDFLKTAGTAAAGLYAGSINAFEDPVPESYRKVVCVSDIAVDGLPGAEATANMIAGLPNDTLILMPGDLAYDFDSATSPSVMYFDRTHGKSKDRIMPARGNHDKRYYFEYFGERVDPYGLGCYEFPINEWWTGISINSDLSMKKGSRQYNQVKSLIENRKTKHVIAEWHYPLYSSGDNGDNIEMQDMVQLFYDVLRNSGRVIIVNGHDHNYEKWMMQDPQGRRDDDNGVHMFHAGGGGAWLYNFPRPHPNSKKRIRAHGILVFDLGKKNYKSKFIPVNLPEFSGPEFTDEDSFEMTA